MAHEAEVEGGKMSTSGTVPASPVGDLAATGPSQDSSLAIVNATAVIQSEWMSHIEGRPIPDGEHAHCLNTSRGPVVFFINKLNRHLVVLKPGPTGGQEVLDLTSLWKLTGQVTSLAATQGADGGLHVFFAKESTQDGLTGKLFGIVPILPHDLDDNSTWENRLREYVPLSLLSGITKVMSINLSLRKSMKCVATVVLKYDEVWKAVNIVFQDEAKSTDLPEGSVNGKAIENIKQVESNSDFGNSSQANEKRGVETSKGVDDATSMDSKSKESQTEIGKTKLMGAGQAIEESKEPIKYPQLTGTIVEFAKHPDVEILPRILPGRFADKAGLYYYFSSKGVVKFGFRRHDGISIWFEPPAEPVNSIQPVAGNTPAGGVLVGTSKCLLMYSAVSITAQADNSDSARPAEVSEVDSSLETAQATSNPVGIMGLFQRVSSANQEPLHSRDQADETGKQAVSKEPPKEQDLQIMTKVPKQLQKVKPFVVHDGPVSHIRRASKPDGSLASIWMRFGSDLRTLGYFKYAETLETSCSNQELKIVPLVEADITSFVTSLSVDGLSETVLYHTATGMNLLERSTTGLWSEQLFEIPAPAYVKMTPAYVSHIKLFCDDSTALLGSKFLLTCTSSVTVLVNEAPRLIDEKPQTVTVDSQGKIEIVNLTEELQTPNFILQNAPGTTMLKDALILDPARRVKERMQKHTSPTELKELTVGKDDRLIFPEATDFKRLSGVLEDLYEQMKSLPEDGTRKKDIEPLEDKTTESWSLFHMVESTIDNLQDIAIQSGHLVVTVAGKIISFVIDCFETALKAVSTIFSTAGAVVGDLQHWLGYVFDWDDIVTTHSSLTTVFNFALSVPDNIIDQASGAIDGLLSALQEKLLARLDVDAGYTQASSSSESFKSIAGDETSDENAQMSLLSHPAIDYILNKLSSLFLGSKLKINLDLDSHTLGSLRKLIDSNSNLIPHLEALAQSVIDGNHIALFQVLEIVGETALVALINALRGMLASFKKALKSIFDALKEVMNKPRSLPLLSALYKFATDSKGDPSLLQITALVIAIPVAITCKTFKGTNFPLFTEENLKGLLTPQSEVSLPSDEASHNPLAVLYNAAVPRLGPWIKEQPRTLGWVDVIHTTITTLSLACPDLPNLGLQEVEPPTPGLVSVNDATIVQTIVQGFGVLASIPMITRDKWEMTAVPELRFQAWGLDAVLRLLEVIESWKAVEDEKAAGYNKALLITRNLLSAVMWSKIALAEHKHRLPEMTDKDYAKSQRIALWTVPESLALCASHIAPATVTQATPPNVRVIVALTTFSLGVAGNASRWARSEYHGETQQAFSAGLI